MRAPLLDTQQSITMNSPQAVTRFFAKLFTRMPVLGRLWARIARIDRESHVPWAPMRKPLNEARACLITTAGLHLRTDPPFDMQDLNGDPTYRVIPADAGAAELMITHNYYDHSDADRDFNIVMPLDRMREMVRAGTLGRLTNNHYSFMGHIDGPHLATLHQQILPRLIVDLKKAQADLVLLTPA